uniref:Probable cytosol aminopeptidase n=2 Tax=environmental samples TaxID=68359 RepID=A0A075GCE4_9EURY|nr:aminopeptidase A/I (CARP, pepA) [uncultured marine group II/III euryarchaeote KM3_13_G12]AIF09796.1 aminopeptidase A/I (CARP, pepA) [uncultured marine group II/III euryarchaeote KM3_41_A09]
MEHQVGPMDTVEQTLILPLFEGVDKPPNRSLTGLSRAGQSQVRSAIASDDFDGKSGKMISLWNDDCKVILVGMGKSSDMKSNSVRDAGANALAALNKTHGKSITVRFTSGWKVTMMTAFAEGMMLRDYKFDKYLSKDDDDDDDGTPYTVTFQSSNRHLDNLTAGCARVSAMATGVHIARDLGNEPANKLTPMEYASRARAFAKGKGNLSVTVLEWDELLEEKMGGLINVGKGSEHPPCMVIWELNAKAKDGPCPIVVGKGITFDTGGISLKPGAGMDEMKFDMHGSATVFGLMVALHGVGHKGHMMAISCMAENSPSSTAYRPGDVIPTYSGKTVEVLNTDAEGRLVLADGLWKAGEYNPEYIIDLATLTGACVIALGHEASGLWSNDDDLLENLRKAAADSGELAWPMPLLPAFEKQMTGSKIADVKNLGERYGGSNSAAAFLKQFVPKNGDGDDAKQYPWAHLDIAGTAWGTSNNAMVAHGATGVHVRTLVRLIDGE